MNDQELLAHVESLTRNTQGSNEPITNHEFRIQRLEALMLLLEARHESESNGDS